MTHTHTHECRCQHCFNPALCKDAKRIFPPKMRNDKWETLDQSRANYGPQTRIVQIVMIMTAFIWTCPVRPGVPLGGWSVLFPSTSIGGVGHCHAHCHMSSVSLYVFPKGVSGRGGSIASRKGCKTCFVFWRIQQRNKSLSSMLAPKPKSLPNMFTDSNTQLKTCSLSNFFRVLPMFSGFFCQKPKMSAGLHEMLDDRPSPSRLQLKELFQGSSLVQYRCPDGSRN